MTVTYVVLNKSDTVIEKHQAPDSITVPQNATVLTPREAAVVGIGSVRQSDGSWSAPPAQVVRVLSSREFIRRFTDAEIVQYETLTVATTTQAAQLRAAKTVLNAAPIVDLDHPDTIKYLGFMKDAGIITDKRIAEIRA